MIQKLVTQTTDEIMKRLVSEYAEMTNKIITENLDVEVVKYIRGMLKGYSNVAEMLGRDITLVPKQEGVKA